MNFFKSVFLEEDPDLTGTESESDSPKNNEELENPEQANPNDDDGGWSFGDLMKTIATKSESVIETYRRDLEEFGTGLKKEIEVAQGSLGNVGHAIDELGNTVLKNTAEIIAHGKEAILAAGNESDSSDNNSSSSSIGRRDSFSSKPYSRFDAQVRSVQCDLNTYCEEPEDLDDYKKWESEFSLDEKEIERLVEENGDMKGMYKRIVPNMIDHETFWFRYFYKVHKLKQAEDLRANLVKRAISLDDEEELSWDIDDEEENSEKVIEVTKEASRLKLEDVPVVDATPPASDEAPLQDSGKLNVVPASNEAPFQDSGKTEAIPKSDETPILDSVKQDGAASTSNQQPSEEELGWDEIEDMSSIDGKEASRSSGSPNRAELRKRLSATEEDEDLSWDIEDDEEEHSSSSKA